MKMLTFHPSSFLELLMGAKFRCRIRRSTFTAHKMLFSETKAIPATWQRDVDSDFQDEDLRPTIVITC